jgi:hypothetical protein
VHIHLAPGADPVAAAHRLESGDLHVAEFAQPTPYAADSRCARTAH